MKTHWPLSSAAAIAALVWLSACSKSNPEEEVTGSPTDRPVELISLWRSSNRYAFRFEMAVNTETPRADRPEPSQQETLLEQEYAVVVTNTLPNGIRHLELEVIALKLDIADGDKYALNFDSENPVMGNDGSPQAEALQKMIGMRLAAQIAADNTVIEINGLRALMDRISKDDERGRGQSLVRRTLGQEFFRRLFETPPAPGKPVHIGESWSVERPLPSGSREPVPIRLTYTFKGWQQHEKKKCALIEFVGDIASATNSPGRMRLMPPFVEKGTLHGKIWFDPELGFTRATVSDQLLTMKTPARARGTNAVPKLISVTVRQHSNLKLLEVSPLGTTP